MFGFVTVNRNISWLLFGTPRLRRAPWFGPECYQICVDRLVYFEILWVQFSMYHPYVAKYVFLFILDLICVFLSWCVEPTLWSSKTG